MHMDMHMHKEMHMEMHTEMHIDASGWPRLDWVGWSGLMFVGELEMSGCFGTLNFELGTSSGLE
jgi:hypothetical protein